MKNEKPVLLQRFPFSNLDDGHERLTRHFNVIQLWQERDPESTIRNHQHEVAVMLTSGGMTTDAAFIDRFPNLKAICNMGVGYDSIDVGHAKEKNVQVSNTPDVLNDCVGDLTWGLILATARGLGRAERYVRAGHWGAPRAQLPLGVRVSGKKLGIVGLGRVGDAIAKRAAGFDMDVRYHNRHARPDVDWTFEKSLIGLATWADFLVIATVGGATTRHLINQPILEALGPQGILINISRGSVVDEKALVSALLNGKLGGAGLDVFDAEPHVPDELKQLENVVILPHIGSATTETRWAMANLVVENAEAFSKTGKVITPVW